MPITMRDIADARLTLELRCRQCRKVVVIPPEVLIRRFPLKAGFLELVWRMRCGDDGMVPDVWLVLDDERVGQEAMRRRAGDTSAAAGVKHYGIGSRERYEAAREKALADWRFNQLAHV